MNADERRSNIGVHLRASAVKKEAVTLRGGKGMEAKE
jgi:hypothetical protein